ncbi:MAG TPA: DUF885 domain-containing protein [Thermoanaerobaculia bacterium]
MVLKTIYWLFAAVLVALGGVAGGGPAASAASETAPAEAARRDLHAVLDEYWQFRLADDPQSRIALGLPVTRLPDPSEAHFREEGEVARRMLERLARIDEKALPHEDWLSLEIAAWECRQAVAFQDFFWQSPPFTTAGLPLRGIHNALSQVPLRNRADLDNYLALVRQYPGMVRELRKILDTGHAKGILVPKAMVDIVEPMIRSARSAIDKPEESPLWVADDRLAGPRKENADVVAFQAELRRLITAEANPALTDLADAFAATRAAAPERVGLGQYPGGEAAYRALVRYHTTLDVTPEEIHTIGLAEVERIDARMAAVRARLGFQGTKAEFHKMIRTDGRFLAKTPEEVGERLMAPMKRIEPVVAKYFLHVPKAPYGVKRLDPQLEGSTFTFGYYEMPTAEEPTGRYRFNGSTLSERPLISAAALIYHELIPGHHFQLNLQRENETIPAFRRLTSHTAFVEGWGEYASDLAGEMGLYSDPYDEYGRLGMDMFLSTRLVVDTGMNLMGWPRQKAIDYMLDHDLESATQITSETLRYSADRPAQALAYKMGSNKIRELRQRAERALGPKFDIRRFHDAVLGSGSMPLSVLEKHIDWWIGEEKKRG